MTPAEVFLESPLSPKAIMLQGFWERPSFLPFHLFEDGP